MKLLLFLMLSLLFSTARGQSTDSAAYFHYQQNSIFWPGGNKYYQGNHVYKYKQLKSVFQVSPEASDHYRLAVKNHKTAIALTVTGLAFATGVFLAQDKDLKTGLAVGTLVSFTIGLPFVVKSSEHMNRAIWSYNRDLLLTPHGGR